MRHGGLIDGMGQERRRVLLPQGFSGARVMALGASFVLHLLAIATLASILDHRSGPHANHSPALTVVSLELARPAVKPILARQPERHGPQSLRRPAPPSSAAQVAVGGVTAESPAILASSAAPSPAESGKPLEDSFSRPVALPLHAAGNPDTALREYQAALWRKIDANRPRGATMKGTALIQFRISTDGTLLTAEVSRSSGNILLDKIALRSVRQSAPFLRPPEDIPDSALTFEIPITIR